MFFVVILIPQLLYTSVITSEQAMSDQGQSDTETKPKVTVCMVFIVLYDSSFSLLVSRETRTRTLSCSSCLDINSITN